jgi:hypothetical protein
VGIADDLRHAGNGSDLLRNTLCVTTGDHDLTGGILTMNAADGSARILVSRGGHSAGVKDDDVCLGRRARAVEPAVAKLALDRSAVGLRGPAAKVFDVERCHYIYSNPVTGKDARPPSSVRLCGANARLEGEAVSSRRTGSNRQTNYGGEGAASRPLREVTLPLPPECAYSGPYYAEAAVRFA